MPPAPASPAVSASDLVLRAKQQEIDAAGQLARRVALVEAIGHLIHALQLERGASSVFVASQGRQFADVRLQALDGARRQEQSLRALIAEQVDMPACGAHAKLLSLMAWVLLGLDALEALRARVGRHQHSAHDTVAAFSRLIAGLVELIFLVADASLLPGVTGRLVAFLHLVQGTEMAGQERALGAQMLASGEGQDAQRQRIAHLIAAQERSLEVFGHFADPALRARWEQQQLSPDTARLERMRRRLCTGPAQAPQDPSASAAWFEACTARMEHLWQLQLALIEQLKQACATQVQTARQDLLDSEGLLRSLRDNPPSHSHAMDRFFDVDHPSEAVPELVHATAPAPLLAMLQAQTRQLATVEAELERAQRTLQERKIIERAKGTLMARLGMREEEAFRALQKTAMDHNRRLLDVAQATLALPEFAFAQAAAPAPAPRTRVAPKPP